MYAIIDPSQTTFSVEMKVNNINEEINEKMRIVSNEAKIRLFHGQIG